MVDIQRFLSNAALVCAAFILAGCANSNRGLAIPEPETQAPAFPEQAPERPGGSMRMANGSPLEFVGYADLSGWGQDNHAAGLAAFNISCDRLLKLPSSTSIGGLASEVADWRAVCEEASRIDAEGAQAFFESRFTPVRMSPQEPGLFTAYFEPVLPASLDPVGAYQYPIYRKPPEVTREGSSYGVQDASGGLTPYYSRWEIDRGSLTGRSLEVAYLNDPVDLFFLHIQGSGRLSLINGGDMRVGFAAKNGHPYQSVGKSMLRRGWAEGGDASAGAIKRLYQRDPKRGAQLLADNPSYIFFRELTGLDPSGGPVGAFGVQLSSGRSLAVDRRYTPLGAPVWVETDSPLGPIRRLMVAQDVGSAILGAQRGDIYWGSGEEAGRIAGQMKHAGSMTMLIPTPLAWSWAGGMS